MICCLDAFCSLEAADMLGRFLCRLNADRSAGADTKSPKHMLRKGTYFACGADHEIPGRVPAAAEDKTGSIKEKSETQTIVTTA
jgi:hypothetical protein